MGKRQILRASAKFAAWSLLLAGTTGARAEKRAIDIANSSLTIHAQKAGAFSVFGHNHLIRAPIASGSVDATEQKVELRVHAGALTVEDANASEKDRAEIRKTMAGPEVLDVDRYPEIAFESTSAEKSGNAGWKLVGNLTLHGQTRPVAVEVRERTGHYVGSARILQSEFGIKAIKVAGGAVRVKDELQIEFDVQLAREKQD